MWDKWLSTEGHLNDSFLLELKWINGGSRFSSCILLSLCSDIRIFVRAFHFIFMLHMGKVDFLITITNCLVLKITLAAKVCDWFGPIVSQLDLLSWKLFWLFIFMVSILEQTKRTSMMCLVWYVLEFTGIFLIRNER